ncbi:MAG: PorV/PorQ family protein [Elusimicrobia bacterium]|nr:PorV/PorQ family protein [Elusimicrobiota bacterium]
MKTLKAFAALLLALTLGAAPAMAAQTVAGAESFDFLNLDANARAVALGGAYTALATDSNALLYNPAGLARVDRQEATFMHNQYLQDAAQEYLAWASKQGFGASLNYLDFGSADRTTYGQPDGTGSRVGMSDLALSGGYGRAFGALAVGGGLKVIHESIDNVSATGAALDAGVLYTAPQLAGLRLGASIVNMGPAVKFDVAKEKLPTELRAGAAYSRDLLGAKDTLAFDLSKQLTDKVRLGIGGETVIGRMMALRMGFTTRNDAGIGITAGVGWVWRDLNIDYAIVPFGDLGLAHRLSLTFRWGAPRSGAAVQ